MRFDIFRVHIEMVGLWTSPYENRKRTVVQRWPTKSKKKHFTDSKPLSVNSHCAEKEKKKKKKKKHHVNINDNVSKSAVVVVFSPRRVY